MLFERIKGLESAVCARTPTIAGAPEASAAGQAAGCPQSNYRAVEDGYFAQAGVYGVEVRGGPPFGEDAKDGGSSWLTGLEPVINFPACAKVNKRL
jgi:hypothetical protein